MSYICLTGCVPFRADKIEDLHDCILNNEVSWKNTVYISSRIKTLIDKMLIKDPNERISLKQIAKELNIKLEE